LGEGVPGFRFRVSGSEMMVGVQGSVFAYRQRGVGPTVEASGSEAFEAYMCVSTFVSTRIWRTYDPHAVVS